MIGLSQLHIFSWFSNDALLYSDIEVSEIKVMKSKSGTKCAMDAIATSDEEFVFIPYQSTSIWSLEFRNSIEWEESAADDVKPVARKGTKAVVIRSDDEYVSVQMSMISWHTAKCTLGMKPMLWWSKKENRPSKGEACSPKLTPNQMILTVLKRKHNTYIIRVNQQVKLWHTVTFLSMLPLAFASYLIQWRLDISSPWLMDSHVRF